MATSTVGRGRCLLTLDNKPHERGRLVDKEGSAEREGDFMLLTHSVVHKPHEGGQSSKLLARIRCNCIVTTGDMSAELMK